MKGNNYYIIIVTFNGIKWLPKCLDSCKNKNIIVVDNNSTDNTINYIKKYHPNIILLEQTENLGFGVANNLGIKYAIRKNAKYVFLLNQDAYIEKNTIDNLIEVSKKNKEYGIISPIHLNGKGDNLDTNFQTYLSENKFFLFDSIKNKYRKSIYDVPFVNAAGWLLPRKTLDIVGGFDPIFFHYGEDDNFCQRVLFHNLKIGVVTNTFILHDRENRKGISKRTEKESLILKERQLKYKWGNINIEIDKEIQGYLYKLKKTAFKYFIKLNFKKVKKCLRELAFLEKIYHQISKSREINKKVGANYL